MLDTRPTVSPVFVDPTGRRRRTIRIAAIAGAVALLSTVGLLVAAFLGAPLGPLISVPEPISGPPPAVERPEAPPASSTGRPTQRGSAAGERARPVTTPAPAGATTTTGSKGKPAGAPGRPSDLPTPPGHTR